MGSIRPSYHLFASVDSCSSTDLSDHRNGGKNLSYPRRLISNSIAHEATSEPIAATVALVTENSSRALLKSRDAKTGHTFGRMSESGIGGTLAVPPDLMAEELKTGAKGSHFWAFRGNCTRRVERRIERRRKR
ncbi:unnamed protein product [Musa acuminata var. zebrina]